MSCQRPKMDAERWLDQAFETLRWLDHLLRGQELRDDINQKLTVGHIAEAVTMATNRLQSVVQCERRRLGLDDPTSGVTHDKDGNLVPSPSKG